MSALDKKGTSPEGGTPYEKTLQVIFALGGFQHFSNNKWELCNEVTTAGKFDDLCFKLDSEYIVLQSKHKKNYTVLDSRILSTNPNKDKNEFSIGKYFLSYLTEIKSQFSVKFLIICTNCNVQVSLMKEEKLEIIQKIFDNYCKIYSIKSDQKSIQEVKEAILGYQESLKPKHENYDKWKTLTIDDKDIETFLEKFLFLSAKDSNLEIAIREKLEAMKKTNSFTPSSYKYVLDQIQEWYRMKPSKRINMNNIYIKAILYGETNKAYIEDMLDEIIIFKHYISLENYKFFHVVISENYQLHLKKILNGLWLEYKKINKSIDSFCNEVLLLNVSNNSNAPEDIINCFELPKFKFLLLVIMEENKKISGAVQNFERKIIEENLDKKIIILSNKNLFYNETIVQTIDSKISFSTLSHKTQRFILEKPIFFQGVPSNLEILIERKIDMLDNLVDEQTISNLISSKEFRTGRDLKKLGQIENYYITRKLNKMNESFTEENILSKCKEPALIICDQPGTGKSTLLIKLTNDWKEKFVNYWVINLDLEVTIKYINENKTRSNLMGLLRLHEKCESHLEKQLISILNKIILLDGVDEVRAADRKLLFSFFKQISVADDIFKIIIATRSYTFILDEIKSFDNLDVITLEEFSSEKQIEYLNKYLKHQLKVDVENSKGFVQDCPTVLKHFLNIPLYTKMIADIFSDQIVSKSIKNNSAMNIISNTYELFKLFIAKQKDIFIKNKCRSESNSTLSNILSDAFDRYIEDLQIQAVRNNLANHPIRDVFDIDPYRKVKLSALNTGILEVQDNNFKFIHKTFEEYFVAQIIWNNIKERGSNKEKLEQIRSELFLNIEKINICHFIDCILEKETYNYLQDLTHKFCALEPQIEPKKILSLASQGSVNVLKLLFDNCDSFKKILNFEGDYGESVLLLSAHHLPTVQYLVGKGADIHFKDKNGFTVLHYAITRFSSLENFELQLLALSKSLLYKDMLIHMNSVQKNLYKYGEIDNYLKRPNSDRQKGLILQRHADNFQDIVSYFVSKGLDLNSQTNIGTTVLHYIAYCGLAKEFKHLVNAGAQVGITDFYGNNIIHYAVLGGSLEIIQYLKDLKVRFNAKNLNGVSPVHFIPIGNSVEVFNFFITNEIGIETEDSYGRTVLFYINAATSLELVEWIVAHDNNVHRTSTTDMNYTALHMASYTNSVDIVEYLVTNCHFIPIGDKHGQLPAHYAAEGDAVKVLKYFQKTTPLSTVVDSSRATVLHLAAIGDSLNAVIYLVEELGMDPNVSDRSKKTPLHYAAGSGSLKVLEYFVNRKVDTNIKDEEGATIMHYAAGNASLNVLIYLVENTDTLTDIFDRNGKHPIHYAAEHDFLEGVKYFLNKGVKIDIKDSNDSTILHYSGLGQSAATAKFIYKCEKELYKANKFGKFPVHFAVENTSSVAALNYFIEECPEETFFLNKKVPLLHFASATNSIKAVKYFILERLMKLQPDGSGRYPFHYAAEGNAMKVINFFSEIGIRMDAQDKNGSTVVHSAALKNATDALHFFVSSLKMHFNQRDFSGMLPLHYASSANALESATYLLSLSDSQDLGVLDYINMTVLHWCASGNAKETFKYFIKDCRSNDINTEDHLKRKPIHVAVQHDAIDVVKYIFEKCNMDKNILDRNNNNLLHWGAKYNSINVIRYLIEDQNMDFLKNMKNVKKLTPINIAVKEKSLKVVEYFGSEKYKKISI